MLVGAGPVLDVTCDVGDYDAAFFAGDGIERLRRIVYERRANAVPMPAVRVGAPVARAGKIVCIGLNYADHAAESGAPIPTEPVVF